MSQIKLATRITEYTLLGVRKGDFPLNHGNCFSVACEDGVCYKVVNFVLENLEEGLRREKISWPIKVKTISDRHAVIHDERIPDNWYQSRFCEVCCPSYLLPLPQLLTHERQVASGYREERPGMVCYKLGSEIKWEK